jgi:hypothetical protein
MNINHTGENSEHFFMQENIPLCSSPKQGRPIHPLLKRQGLSGPLTVKQSGVNIVRSCVNWVLLLIKCRE